MDCAQKMPKVKKYYPIEILFSLMRIMIKLGQPLTWTELSANSVNLRKIYL